MGRLRESRNGKNRADLIVLTKSPEELPEIEQDKIIGKVNPLDGQQVYFSSIAYQSLYLLSNPSKTLTLDTIKGSIYVLAALANPFPVISHLENYSGEVHPFTFPDHHDFTTEDIQQLMLAVEKDPSPQKTIVTTEKDATKLRSLQHAFGDFIPVYVLPIKIAFLNTDGFNQRILTYLKSQ